MKARDLFWSVFIIGLIYGLSKVLNRSNNDSFIDKMDPSVRSTVRNFLRDIEALGYDPVIRDSTRTYADQAAYKKANSKNASPGNSRHEIGLAIDLDVYKDGKVFSKRTPKSLWLSSGVPRLASEYGINWGGNFKNYADNNHFYFL